jgi:branched-chain amino acid transport system ATP-binding protein
MTAVLRIQGLTVSYGGVRALSGLDLEVRERQIVGLIGPNGAGKTTAIDAITGFARSTGRVWLDGTELSGRAPHERARRGLARTWQSTELFDTLTVRENLSVASTWPSAWRLAREVLTGKSAGAGMVETALRVVGLQSLADEKPNSLTQGQRTLVGVARALAAKPRLILLDEPAAGLDTRESQSLGTHLRQTVDLGLSLLLIDHDMGLVLSVCDYVYVLDFGVLIAQGAPGEVRRNPAVVAAYLGNAATADLDKAVSG